LPALALAAGCLARPTLVPALFSIDPPVVAEAPRSAGAGVVSVGRVTVDPPFDGRPLVYRTGEHRLERDPYASFAASPADLLTTAVRAYLRRSALARDVVEPGGAPRADLLVEVRVAELSGDLRRADDAAAVLRLHFVVVAGGGARQGAPALLQKEYSSRTRVARRTADAIVTAWNEGLAVIMKDFVDDLTAALGQRPNVLEK
jgi:hypothetical protein